MPVHLVIGEENCLIFGLFANIHGTEYYQNRTIRTVVQKVEPEKLCGTIIAVHVANPYSFAHRSRCIPNPPEETLVLAVANYKESKWIE